MEQVQSSGHAESLEKWRIKTAAARKDVFAALMQHGWVATTGTALAQKSFLTAVGVKVAHAYMGGGDFCNWTLSGDYQSEGRNILEPHAALIPRAARFDLVLARVSHFVKSVDEVVGNSYAARLL
jgi:hypothetical protein